MALAINIEDLLNKQKIESSRIEFKKGWNPASIYHSVCPFFLKELDLTEGRSTGVPTIQAKLAENGSPRAIFETTDDRLTFLVTIPVHDGCNESSVINRLGSEKSSERKKKSSERILDLIKNKPTISAVEIAMEIDMSARGVEKQIRKLREEGVIKRIGADFGGYWEIISKDGK